MINTYEFIDDLNKKLILAEEIDESGIADQLIAIGFECIRCGECCRSKSGDNCVIVFPAEIIKIIKVYGLKWDDVCKPSTPQFIDSFGSLHAFEWELKRNENRDCSFLKENFTFRCRIYDQRPRICNTYPFYLVFEEATPKLRVSDCPGIGVLIQKDDALDLATSLKNRLIEDIREEIMLLKNLEETDDWKLIRDHSQLEVQSGSGIIVHDSLGSHVC